VNRNNIEQQGIATQTIEVTQSKNKKEEKKLVSQLVLFALGMFAFGFALIPLYDIFCEVTGFRTQNEKAIVSAMEVNQERTITVEFIGNTQERANWDFKPTVTKMEVFPGQIYTTNYFAKNKQNKTLVGHAVPDVKPVEMNKHFKKLECFCFTEQEFLAQEGRDMPVQFVIDPKVPKHIERMTLSYSFFAKPEAKAELITVKK